MAAQTDAMLERAVRERWPIARTVEVLLPILAEPLRALGVLVRTVDDTLTTRSFPWPSASGEETRPLGAIDLDELEDRLAGRSEPLRLTLEEVPAGQRWLAYPLEVAGEPLGETVIAVPAPVDEELAGRLLRTWCEHLDTHLAAAQLARRRHRAQRRLTAALRHPSMEDALRRAADELAREVAFDTLVVAWRYPDAEDDVTVLVQEAAEGRVHERWFARGRGATDASLRRWALDPRGAGPIAEALGLGGHFEEALVHGVTHRRVLGRVLVGRRAGGFSLYDRELLEAFSDVLAQRLVDLQREWTLLSVTFPRPVVERMLRHEDYAWRWLRPVEQQLAIMYTDISGFTRLCGEVLREPSRVAELVDRWSARAVDILWEEGGAFDKMVGDCIIGLWGPPFFEMSPREACRRAARAAWRIREWTTTLVDREELAGLFPAGQPPLQVSTGLQWTSAAVGRFGPNGDYTAFGDGMNNAARLQGLAKAGEILCMESFCQQLEAPDVLGPPRSAPAKNVAEPLRFRALLAPPPAS